MTVRSATSLRISWIARRVSASMSRRVCSRSSSRWSRAFSSVSRSWTSPALRARATMSSACARASRRRSRYSCSSCCASARVRSATSMDSSIARWRLSSACVIAGHAYLRSTSIATTNASSVQIIRPTFGLTRKLELWSSAEVEACARTNVPSDVIRLTEEERDQAEDERVEHDRLGEREAQPLDRRDLVAHLGLAGHRLDDLAEDVAHAHARADGAQAGADAEGDGLEALAGIRGLSDDRDQIGADVHGFSFQSCCLVVRLHGAPEVDGGQGGEDEGLKRRHQAHLEDVEGDGGRDREPPEGRDAEQHREAAGHEEDQQVAGEDV